MSKARLVKLSLVAFVALAVSAAALTWIWHSEVDAARLVSDEFVQDLSDGNGPDAYSVLSPAFKRITNQAAMSALTAKVKGILIRKPEQTDWNISIGLGSPERATVNYTAQGHLGGGVIIITLEKVDGSWAVRDYSVHIR